MSGCVLENECRTLPVAKGTMDLSMAIDIISGNVKFYVGF